MTKAEEQDARAVARVLLRLEEKPGPLATPCWVWPGARSSGGYGYVRVSGKLVTVHVLLYRVLACRRLRRGQQVHHRCGVPACANPEHLEAVTAKQHGRRHRRAVASCGHPYDMVMGRRKTRRCRRCRNAARRAQYAESRPTRAVA